MLSLIRLILVYNLWNYGCLFVQNRYDTGAGDGGFSAPEPGSSRRSSPAAHASERVVRHHAQGHHPQGDLHADGGSRLDVDGYGSTVRSFFSFRSYHRTVRYIILLILVSPNTVALFDRNGYGRSIDTLSWSYHHLLNWHCFSIQFSRLR